MLNEAWRVWQALRNAGIETELPHPLIKPLPASEKNLLRVRLKKEGHVTSVEDVTGDERTGMRRIVQTSDGSFPVLKVNQPLLRLPVESTVWNDLARSKAESGKLTLLRAAFANAPVRTWAEAGWKWDNSREKADLLLEKLRGDETCASVVTVAERFKKALMNSEDGFVAQIADLALRELATGRLESGSTVRELLVGKGKDKGGKDKKISVLLALELDGDESIYRSSCWGRLSEVLPTNLANVQREHKHHALTSAFGGDGDLLQEPFPQVKLPVLGSYFPLLSMASDADKAKCNKRYGLTEYTVCPVTSAESRRMHAALQWLVTRDEGTTWRGVASGKFEVDPRTHKKKVKKDLLIVFVRDRPDLDCKTASYFGSGAEITEAKFDVDSKAVCDAFDAVVRKHPTSELNLFLIRKASDGQAQIALAESPMVKDVLEAARRWRQAAQDNTPRATLYLQPATGSSNKEMPGIRDARPLAPYPEQVVRLLSSQWIRDGSSPTGANGQRQKAKQEIVGPGLGEVLGLMLRTEGRWEPAAWWMLDLLLQRVGPLLIGVFGAQRAYGPRHEQKRSEPFLDYPRESRETALRAVGVLGILLDALGSRKEEYMKEASYEVGQLLALADTLHKDYCVVVRKGELPNSLIGTSLMRRALDSPVGALADLSERMMEYVRWAKVAQTSQDWAKDDPKRIAVYEARKKLRQYQTLAESLGSCNIPTECNDLMKAHLLLGFLASPPTEEHDDERKDENL